MNTLGYCVRVDALDGYADKLGALKLCTDYKSMVAVKHKGKSGENVHYHIVIQTSVASQAFRVRMKKLFDQGKGNGHMSIKPWDGCADAISYLFHEDENTTLLVQHNVSDETIVKAKERNREVVALVQASKSKASWHLEELIYQQVRNPAPGTRSEVRRDDVSIGKELILASLRNGKYMPQAWHLKAMVNRIQFRLLDNNVDLEEQFASQISESIFAPRYT